MVPIIQHTKPSTLWDADWKSRVRDVEIEVGRTICGAKTKTTLDGRPCERKPTKGRDRCMMHGGHSPRGVQSPHFRNRGYARDIPRRMAAKMERAMMDPDLSSLKSELALIDVRLGELVSKLPEQHTKESWVAVRRRIAQALESLDDTSDPEEIRVFLDAALEDLDVIRSDTETWKEITDMVEVRRRTAVEERKREVELEGTVTAAQFHLVTGALGNAVNEEVGACEWLTEEQQEELIARIGARFGQTLRYPILEPDTDPMTPILEAHPNGHGRLPLDV